MQTIAALDDPILLRFASDTLSNPTEVTELREALKDTDEDPVHIKILHDFNMVN
jgi:hypothetical protein